MARVLGACSPSPLLLSNESVDEVLKRDADVRQTLAGPLHRYILWA